MLSKYREKLVTLRFSPVLVLHLLPLWNSAHSFCHLSGDSDPCRSPWLDLHLRVIQLLQLKLLTLEKTLLKRAVTQGEFLQDQEATFPRQEHS